MKGKFKEEWQYNPNQDAVNFLVHQADRVGKWNLTARGKRERTMEAIARQKSFTKEEWSGPGEFLASYAVNDKVGTLDGLVDMFVTESEAVFMSLDPGMSIRDQIQELKFIPYLDFSTKEIPDLQTICSLLFSFNGNWKQAITEVLDSNDSKFEVYSAMEVLGYDAHCKAIEVQGRYTGVHWELREGKVIYKSGKGKILKGRKFFEPDLRKFV
jgi:hypothetical protein